jgi:hypothetical protein
MEQDPLDVALAVDQARVTLVLDAAAQAGLAVHEDIRPTVTEVEYARSTLARLAGPGVSVRVAYADPRCCVASEPRSTVIEWD